MADFRICRSRSRNPVYNPETEWIKWCHIKIMFCCNVCAFVQWQQAKAGDVMLSRLSCVFDEPQTVRDSTHVFCEVWQMRCLRPLLDECKSKSRGNRGILQFATWLKTRYYYWVVHKPPTFVTSWFYQTGYWPIYESCHWKTEQYI